MPDGSKRHETIKLDQHLDPVKDFLPQSLEEWKKIAGRDFITTTGEGIDIHPLYVKEDLAGIPYLPGMPGFRPYLRGTGPTGYIKKIWDICQEIESHSPADFNTELKYDLQRGQNSILMVLDSATRMGLDSDRTVPGEAAFDGIPISTLEDFRQALDGIDLEKYPLYVDAGLGNLEISMMLAALCTAQKPGANPGSPLFDTGSIRGSIENDPIGILLRHGKLPLTWDMAMKRMAVAVQHIRRLFPGMRSIGIKGTPFRDAGGNAVQELAFTLATAVTYIDNLLGHGLASEDIAGSMRFTFASGGDFFLELAKLRAARILWTRVLEAYGCSPERAGMVIHVRTCRWNRTGRSPYVNMLRTVTEALAAAAGGVDSLQTEPFDASCTAPGQAAQTNGTSRGPRFSRRIARNIQLILAGEARLDRLIDPGGGSYYLEKLTYLLAQKAWAQFQEVERRGGMLEALMKGYPQAGIAAAAGRARDDLRQGKTRQVGINAYRDETETAAEACSPGEDKEQLKIFRERESYLANYRGARDNHKIIALMRRVPGLTEHPHEHGNILEQGAEMLRRGLTLGELFYAGRVATGEVIYIECLDMHRLSEDFETGQEGGSGQKDKAPGRTAGDQGGAS